MWSAFDAVLGGAVEAMVSMYRRRRTVLCRLYRLNLLRVYSYFVFSLPISGARSWFGFLCRRPDRRAGREMSQRHTDLDQKGVVKTVPTKNNYLSG